MNTKNLCYLKGEEHVFLYNLIPYKNKWYCDVISSDDRAIESKVKTVLFDSVTFANDPKGEKKNYLIQCETEKPGNFYKKITEEFKEKIKKIQQLETAEKK